jgi:hypothetical protein
MILTIYVAEINGRAVVAFRADNYREAEALVKADWFRDDLSELESDGAPLWDGESEIHCRQAVAEESDAWDKSKARAILDGSSDAEVEDDDDDESWLMYLIPVTDPTDKDDEG